MKRGLDILTVIPARGGSKGVPRKNLRLVGGKPLVVWSVEAALRAKSAGAVMVSSDSAEILKTAQVSKRVLALKRPADLARDDTPTLPVFRHAVLEHEKALGHRIDYLIGLEPTTPFRSAADIDGSLRQARRTGADVVTTVRAAAENPYFVQVESRARGWYGQVKRSKAARRQDAPAVYTLNGAVYVFRRDVLFKIAHLYDAKRFGVYEMPWERSLDLDSEADFAIADFLLSRRLAGGSHR